MATATSFAQLALLLGEEARRLNLCAPGFRSPPRVHGVNRTLRRRAGGVPMVSIRLHGRTLEAVIADMIQGILVANDIADFRRSEVAAQLQNAVDHGRQVDYAA